VKQGGILSPTLFCIYMDETLYKLKVSNVGCYIGNVFLGGLGYADDLCLLSPNRGFSKENDVVFNSSKCYIL